MPQCGVCGEVISWLEIDGRWVAHVNGVPHKHPKAGRKEVNKEKHKGDVVMHYISSDQWDEMIALLERMAIVLERIDLQKR